MSKAIRNQYEDLGVEGYYEKYGKDYTNPHFDQIKALLINNQHRVNYQNVLDFCCGAGEVTQVVQSLGFNSITGSDPYTQEAYTQHTQLPCETWSFEWVMKNGLPVTYSSIICSFALHLCPDEILFPVTYQLFQATSQLVIITPHKRPALEKYENFKLDWEDHVLTARGKQVRMKAYSN
ncbi:MAG: hypothetical protein AAFO07_13810 [Bacteroidota bacterium]